VRCAPRVDRRVDRRVMRMKRWLGMPRETVLFYDRDPDMDIKSLLAGVRVPTLVTHGTEDRQVPFAAAEYLAAHIPGAQLYPFKGYGHVPLFTGSSATCCAASSGAEWRQRLDDPHRLSCPRPESTWRRDSGISSPCPRGYVFSQLRRQSLPARQEPSAHETRWPPDKGPACHNQLLTTLSSSAR
jgi:hypothetical protein